MSEQMRAGFEKWYSSDGLFPRSIERNGEDYKFMAASQAWVTWQAALATQPQAPQGAVKPCGCKSDWSNPERPLIQVCGVCLGPVQMAPTKTPEVLE
jgi:hypothetical protein